MRAALANQRKLIPLSFFAIFAAITGTGISWGLPALWHPDELVKRVIWALHGEWVFDTRNFLYPSLPKYVMFWLGRALYALGYEQADFVLAARALSVLLGGLLVVLTWQIARRVSAGVAGASFAALLMLTSSELAQHARYAHNDIYVAFFSALAVPALLEYQKRARKRWLYASFALIGLAVSSKFHAAGLLIVPAILYLQKTKGTPLRNRLGTLFLGITAAYLAFGFGTPRALFSFGFYWNETISALLTQAIYGRRPDTLIGFLGSWTSLRDALGRPVLVVYFSSLGWAIWHILRRQTHRQPLQFRALPVLLLSLLGLALPLWVSYFYPSRYFLPALPLLFVLCGLFLEDVLANLAERARPVVLLAAFSLLAYSALRAFAVLLLFQNDARIPASAYLTQLESGSRIEYTLYPPAIPAGHFGGGHNYPLVFIKVPGQQLPTSPLYEFNTGAVGLAQRQPDYLIVDSFTYARFADEFVCRLHPADCALFAGLLAGRTDYWLLQAFRYDLPPWLPSVHTAFLNPEIRIYERR